MTTRLRPHKTVYERQTLVAAAARTATAGDAGAAARLPIAGAYVFVLDVTEAATDVGDTLDVFVQALLGSTWVDVAHFTQVLGNGGAKRYVAKVCAGVAEAMFSDASALAAGSVRHVVGDAWRARWVIVDADADASFTFSVVAVPV
ncbi:MAG: hypothetical protein IT460_15255 [Planctomycetes bacterium]|nr:hypothetical protein [Planctomycetota bacterium]